MLRGWLFTAALLLAGCSDIDNATSGAIDKAGTALARQQFPGLCEKHAGLTINAPGSVSGIAVSVPRVEDALWLLFDVGAPFVEMEPETYPLDDGAIMRPWGALPKDRDHVWRFDRKPANDPSCAPFHAWIASQRAARDFERVVSGRWLDPKTYGNQCVKFTATAASARTPTDQTGYRLQRESFFLQQVFGCGVAWQTNYTLVDQFGNRLFQARSLTLSISEGCLTSIDGFRSAEHHACGKPTERNLFEGQTILMDVSTPEASQRFGIRSEGCRLEKSCEER